MLTDIAKAAEEASPMRASSLIRQRGDQRRNRRLAAVGVLSAVAVGAIVATGSLFGMHHTANNLPAILSSATVSPAATTSPTATASPTPAAPSTSSIQPTKPTPEDSAPSATLSQLSVAISGFSATTVAIGGKEIEFTVTVTNPTPRAFRNIAPVVFVGHCTCVDTSFAVAPEGTLKWQRSDGSWTTVQYAREGSDIGYINAKQVPGFTLGPGARASFTFRMGFTATQQVNYHYGQTSVNVTMVGLAGYTAVGPVREVAGTYAMAILGSNLAVSAPIQVTTN